MIVLFGCETLEGCVDSHSQQVWLVQPARREVVLCCGAEAQYPAEEFVIGWAQEVSSFFSAWIV
jgi:hypothetical protein